MGATTQTLGTLLLLLRYFQNAICSCSSAEPNVRGKAKVWSNRDVFVIQTHRTTDKVHKLGIGPCTAADLAQALFLVHVEHVQGV